MSSNGFDSPEQAATSSFPANYCRVVAARVRGDDAYVLLDTGSAGQPYLYGVNCARRDGRWHEGSSSNGPGWSQAGPNDRLGTLVVWGEAPADADMVQAEFKGMVVEEPITAGVYLAAWWRTPCPEESWPHVQAFRMRGTWVQRASLRDGL
jgi:hypothetical protein